MVRIILGAVLAAIGGSCNRLPRPTSKPVSPRQIVGSWSYASDYPNANIRIEFRPDGTFSQTVKLAGKPDILESKGSWSLDGSKLVVRKVLMYEEGAWKPDDDRWLILDSSDDPSGVQIFGGAHPDPDVYVRFKREASSTRPTSD